MEQSFLKNSLLLNSLKSSLSAAVQPEKLDEMLAFYNNKDKQICFVEGDAGSFKTELFKESRRFLTDNTLVFGFRCFEGTTLDDIFLSFFEDLKRYAQEKKVSFTKIETNSLSQRIIKYLSSINLPCVILIDSLEEVFNKQNQSEKDEIIRFIKHLHSMNKFKIVLISSYFTEEFDDLSDASVCIKTEPYTKEQILSVIPDLSPDDLDKLYALTGGNRNYIYITANIAVTLNTSAGALLEEFETKRVSFVDFILQKLITFVTEKVKKSLYYLALVNEPISGSYLIKQGFFTQEQLNYVVEKGLVSNEYNSVYVKNYLKKYLIRIIAHLDKIKIHTFWRDFYSSQLPLKPKDRVILISRNTMRSQIEYHSGFIIQQRQESDNTDMSLMSYLNSNLTAWNIKNTNIKDDIEEKKERPTPPKSISDKEKRFEKYELTKDEISLLSVPVDLRKQEEHAAKQQLYRTFEQKEDALKQEKKQKSLPQLYNSAKELEDSHDFETAFVLYYQAWQLVDDTDFKDYEPLLLERLAVCAKRMNKTMEAIDFYNRLTELYASLEQIDKMNEVRLNIAQIYKETFKLNHARVIYENFINKKSTASNSILARSYIEIAGIEEDSANTEKAVEYYKKAFAIADEISNTQEKLDAPILAQAYFKYALILDDFSQTQAALDFYQRSIRTAKEGNIYLSAAYTNVGQIIREQGNPKKAADYYKMALKTDIANSNYEGVYYICLKLARLSEEIAPESVADWLLKSLSAAKRTKENIYITNAYLETGDYYFDKGDNQKALKAFLLAKKSLEKYEHSQESEQSIELRLNDLKSILPRNIIDKVIQDVENNGR